MQALEDNTLTTIIPETLFYTPKIHLRYTIYSKFSEKLVKPIYIIYYKIYSSLKVANLPLLYKANKEMHKKFNDYITKLLTQEPITAFYLFEIKRSINFMPDKNMYEQTHQFVESLKTGEKGKET